MEKDGYSFSDGNVTTAVRDTFYLERKCKDIDFLSWFDSDETFEDAKERIEELHISAERKNSNHALDVKYYSRDLQYFYDFYKVIRS